MGQLNGNRIFSAFVALFSPSRTTGFNDTTDQDLVANTYGRIRTEVYLTDGGTAATGQTATPFWTNDTGGNVLLSDAKIMTPVAVTANASNNVTFLLEKVDAAGINPVTLATYTSDVAGGSTVAHVPKALTNSVVAGALTIASGFSLRITATKGGTGVAIATATSQAYLTVKLEPTV
jgi:hypothetical protein